MPRHHQPQPQAGTVGRDPERTSWIYDLSHFDFAAELHESLPAGIELTVSTIHKYKGREAHLVILADVTEGQVPLLHKDNELYAPFLEPGADPIAEALIDERRLFYVALSRATEQMWILTESGRHSPFLKELNVPFVTPRRPGVARTGSQRLAQAPMHAMPVQGGLL